MNLHRRSGTVEGERRLGDGELRDLYLPALRQRGWASPTGRENLRLGRGWDLGPAPWAEPAEDAGTGLNRL
jgi:hypothetical protein